MKSLFLLICLVVCGVTVSAQDHPPAKTAAPPSTTSAPAAATPAAVVITDASTPLELAKAAFSAQGGEKFRNVQNMMLRGSVTLYPPNSAQSIPGA
ncbi:MAG TPA: hypothetical protein VF088_15435, partial [Pyrinomonadaceae bacterium]